MQYSNPDLDAMIDAAAQATDDAERKTMYDEIRQIVQEDAPLIFVHYETINYLMTQRRRRRRRSTRRSCCASRTSASPADVADDLGVVVAGYRGR